MQDDDTLMLAYRTGDLAAFDTLVLRHRGNILGFLRRMLRDEALAEEAMSDTFFKVHRAASTYEARGQFKTWLFRIAHRLALNALRDNRHWQNSTTRLEDQPGGVASLQGLGPGGQPDTQLEHRESSQIIEAALKSLPELHRTVFLLYYREGMATADIATVVEIPSGSVRAYLTMARRTLREALELAARPREADHHGRD